MHILTFLIISGLLLAATFGVYLWLAEGGGSIEKVKALGKSISGRFNRPASEQWDTPRKIIRVHIDDAIDEFICAVVGESFTNSDGQERQQIIKRFAKSGIQVHLEREPDNPYDPTAIAVYLADQQIGYLKRDVAERLAEKIDSGNYAAGAAIHSVNGGTKSKPNFGVTLIVTVFLVR